MGRRGQHMKDRQAERFARYCELRDGGAYPVDAARELGMSESVGARYELARKRARGIPAGRQSTHWSER